MFTQKNATSALLAFGLALGLFALVVSVCPAQAKSILDPGDIAIIGYAFDDPDQFAFVALVEIDVGTMITFTDNGWYAAGGFRPGEGYLSWTAASSIVTGTVIVPDNVSTMLFSTNGDQIFAYQGTDAAPSFVYALHSNGTTWDADATSANTSALPTGLTDGSTAVAIPEVDNAVYTGTTFADVSHNAAYFLPLIGNPDNWQTDNITRLPMPSTAFTGPNAITVQGINGKAFSFVGLVVAFVLAGGLVALRKHK